MWLAHSVQEVSVRIGRRSVLARLAALGGCGWLESESIVESLPGTSPFTREVRIEVAELDAFFATGRAFYAANARAWIVGVPPEAKDALATSGDYTNAKAAETGFLCLYQKCTHLGCRVPECLTSGLFECPCHGSRYTRFGEYLAGPAPRGLDRFPSRIEDNELVIDVSTIVEGLPRGVHPSREEAIGPLCIVVTTPTAERGQRIGRGQSRRPGLTQAQELSLRCE